MGVTDTSNVLARPSELHCHNALRDQLGDERADRVHAEHAIGFGIGQYLDKAAGIAERACSAVGHERKRSRAIGCAGVLELLFGLTHPRDLRRSVDYPRYGVEIDVSMLAGDTLRNRDPLLLGLVREHRPASDLADSTAHGRGRPA